MDLRYHRSCRERVIRYPVPKKIWIAAVLALILVAAVFVGLIYVGTPGSMFRLDFIYAIGMAMVIPNLLVQLSWIYYLYS